MKVILPPTSRRIQSLSKLCCMQMNLLGSVDSVGPPAEKVSRFLLNRCDSVLTSVAFSHSIRELCSSLAFLPIPAFCLIIDVSFDCLVCFLFLCLFFLIICSLNHIALIYGGVMSIFMLFSVNDGFAPSLHFSYLYFDICTFTCQVKQDINTFD